MLHNVVLHVHVHTYRYAFAVFDTDGDGYITLAQLRSYMASMAYISESFDELHASVPWPRVHLDRHS